MSRALESIADLREQVRDLQSQLQQILKERVHEADETKVRLVRATGQETTGFQPFIFLTANGDDRGEQHAVAQMVSDPKFLAFFQDGQWHGVKAGDCGCDSNPCDCAIVDVLAAVAERAGAPLLSSESARLSADCGCDAQRECLSCIDGDMPATLDVEVEITQFAIYRNAMDFQTTLNGITHTVTMDGCDGELIIDAGTVSQLVVGLPNIEVGMPMRTRVRVVPGAFMMIEIIMEIMWDGWQLFDRVITQDQRYASPFDCHGNFTMPEVLTSDQGTFRIESAKIRQTPSSPPPEPTERTITSTAYNVVETDRFLWVDATLNNVTINLLAATEQPWELVILRIDGSGNTVTIDGDAAETINGSTTISLASQYAKARIKAASGTNYNLA